MKANYWSLQCYESEYRWEAERLRPADRIVLDVGCNAGYGSKVLSSRDRLVVGVDIDAPLVAKNVRRGDPNVCYTSCDIFSLPVDCSDAVVCNNIIEHIQNDHAFVFRVKELLRDGGIAFITTPNARKRLAPGEAPFNPLHCREYVRADFEELVRTHFAAVEMYGLYTGSALTEWFKRRIYHKGVARYAVYLPEFIKAPLRRLVELIYAPSPTGIVSDKTFTICRLQDRPDEEPMDFIAVCNK